jgi:FkbM family methyltransferase
MQSPIKITYLMSSFNEESRIGDVLHHAVLWADEVLILDKQSTDRTREICSGFGPRVRVVEIPFSPQGHDDAIAACSLASHDWIWAGTCSEIPTKKIIAAAKDILAQKPHLELIYVPRKIHSFGCDTTENPWGIIKYPFLFNKNRITITNTIHKNFHPKNKQNTTEIEYSEDCCVHHFTHATAKGYLSAMSQYFEAEKQIPDQAELIDQALSNLEGRSNLQMLVGRDGFGLECAWRSYWLGVALHGWEKLRNVDVVSKYSRQRKALLDQDWASSADHLFNGPDTPHSFADIPHTPPQALLNEGTGGSASNVEAFDDFLLEELENRPISRMVTTVYQIGAHRFQEKELLFRIFPNLKHVVLFEPIPDLYKLLVKQEEGDHRITILPYAISDQNGETSFNLASNDGASSSILAFGKHSEIFPSVSQAGEITVQTRTLNWCIEQHKLPQPDFLFLDVQGAEFLILSSLEWSGLPNLKLIYTEVSKVEIYQGAKTLPEVEAVLSERMLFAGFCPLSAEIDMHGNALFVSRKHHWLLFPPTPPRALSSLENDHKASFASQILAKILSKKMRRSLRKRLMSVERALRN